MPHPHEQAYRPQARGDGARKHEGLRSTKRPRILGVKQKILLTLESIYHFHSEVFMNNFFKNPALGSVPMWIYHSHINKLNPKGSVTRTNMTEGTLRKKISQYSSLLCILSSTLCYQSFYCAKETFHPTHYG